MKDLIAEAVKENVVTIRLASEFLGVVIGERDIDSSHRVAEPNAEKPRTIIVWFTTYNVRK